MFEAAEVTGLPIWVGLTCEPAADGEIRLRNGDALSDALAVIRQHPVDLINIMHTEVEYIDACLEGLRLNWTGPVGVYAHSGEFVGDQLNFDSTISPQGYCEAAQRWLDQGAQVIGGCCGIGPDHIGMLAQVVNERQG